MTQFLQTWLTAYADSLALNARLNRACADRLRRDVLGSDAAIPSPDIAQRKPDARRGWLSGSGRVSPRRLIAELVSQHRELRRLSRHLGTTGRSLLVVADTRRIGEIRDKPTLARVVRPLDPGQSGSFTDEITAADAVVVFTPNLFAGTSEGSHAVFTIGYLGLSALAMAHPLASVLAAAGAIRGGRGRMFWSVLSRCVDRLLVNARVRDCLMLTSNSHAVELVRWRALANPAIRRVQEILHGVPTADLERYWATMCAAVGTEQAARLAFIPPVPLEIVAPTICGGRARRDLTVSLKYNTVRATSTAEELLGQVPPSDPTRRYRVAINGGASGASDYLTSSFFAVERRLIAFLRELASDRGVPIEIVYSIHPAHLKSGAASQFEGKVGADRLVFDSVETWVSSDLCMSLVSSSIWDARFLGTATVIAVGDHDGLYAADVLEGGTSVRAEESTIDCLRRAFDAMTMRLPLTDEEIEARADRIFDQAGANHG